MIKFQSDSLCLLGVMLSHNQAALLSVYLSVMCQAFAGVPRDELRNEQVYKGQSVVLTCNTSMENVLQFHWTTDSYFFTYSSEVNQTFSNFSSDRLRIEQSLPTKLNIFHAQLEDARLYTCSATSKNGTTVIKWNLTISETPEGLSLAESGSSGYFLYILATIIGFFLFVLISAVCLSRKLWSRKQNRNQVQDQFRDEPGEVVDPQLQAGTNTRTNKKRRSQYMERLNSIYDAY